MPSLSIEMGSPQPFVWPQNMILPISASQVAEITHVLLCPANGEDFKIISPFIMLLYDSSSTAFNNSN
jgi:hypothetical protein